MRRPHTAAFLFALLAGWCVLVGQELQMPRTTYLVQEDPLRIPPELAQFARRVVHFHNGAKAKAEALQRALFLPVEQGGLGITYANDRTRTVMEVWRERKGNCLSWTATFVAAARAADIDAGYAEAINTFRWVRSGSTIRFERHLVAVVHNWGGEELIADFLPQVRRRSSGYVVNLLDETRLRAMFHSNRAVELLEGHELEHADLHITAALRFEPTSAQAWNIRGVLAQVKGHPTEAEGCYRKALEHSPRDVSAISNMESLLREAGRHEEAASFRELASTVRRKDPYFHAFLAAESLESGNLEEAKKRIATALKLNPYDPEFHLFQARMDLEEGRTGDAIKALEAARKWAIPSERERFDTKLALLRRVETGK